MTPPARARQRRPCAVCQHPQRHCTCPPRTPLSRLFSRADRSPGDPLGRWLDQLASQPLVELRRHPMWRLLNATELETTMARRGALELLATGWTPSVRGVRRIEDEPALLALSIAYFPRVRELVRAIRHPSRLRRTPATEELSETLRELLVLKRQLGQLHSPRARLAWERVAVLVRRARRALPRKEKPLARYYQDHWEAARAAAAAAAAHQPPARPPARLWLLLTLVTGLLLWSGWELTAGLRRPPPSELSQILRELRVASPEEQPELAARFHRALYRVGRLDRPNPDSSPEETSE